MSSVTSDAKLTLRKLSVPYCLELFTSLYLYFMRHYKSRDKFLTQISTFKGLCDGVLSYVGFTGKGNNVLESWGRVLSLFFCPSEGGGCEGGKQFMYKNTIKAANVTLGVCTVQLLEF